MKVINAYIKATSIVDGEYPVSTEGVDDAISVKRALLGEQVLWLGPVEAAVEGLQHPDVGISLSTGEVGGGRLLGVEQIHHLQEGGGTEIGRVHTSCDPTSINFPSSFSPSLPHLSGGV